MPGETNWRPRWKPIFCGMQIDVKKVAQVRNRLKDERGITLVELLIALAILLILLAIGYNFFSVGLKSFSGQREQVDNQMKARQVLREISAELRKGDPNEILIHPPHSLQIGEEVSYTFEEDSHTLFKNKKVFVTGIKSFSAEKDEGRISLEITTLAGNSREVTLSSLISLRE